MSGHPLALHREPPDEQGEQGDEDRPAVGGRDGHVGEIGRQNQLTLDRKRSQAQSHDSGENNKRRS